MNTSKLFTVALVSTGLSFGAVAFGHENEKEESISNSDVPAAVQKAAETKAKNGKIVRWEKEGAHYEAVIDKNGKEWGFSFDPDGKLLNKHEEGKEQNENSEKH